MRKQSTAQVIGREGERWFASMLPPEWVLQRPSEDFGIDAVVAVGDSSHVTPFEFGVQIKSCRKWRTSADCLVLYGISIDVARYWALRFIPTLVVAFENSTNRGYYAWAPDLISDEALNGNAESLTLRVPKANKLSPASWKDIEARLIFFHQRFAQALARQSDRDRVLGYISKLSTSLHVLSLAQALPPDVKYGTMSYNLLQSMAHAKVVKTLVALAEYLGTNDPLGHAISSFQSRYYEGCCKVFHPFETLLAERRDTVVVAINEDEGRVVLPQLTVSLAECVKDLLATVARSATTPNPSINTDAAR